MSQESSSPQSAPVFSDDESDSCYSLEIIAELAGTAPDVVIRYQEMGFISTVDEATFDTAALHRLRRIEHLRESYEINTQGLKMMLHLLDEVERLQQERRRRQW